MSTRGSYCVSAPRSSSAPENVRRSKLKKKRKRSKSGGRRKRKRAGARKNQLKSDRIAKTGLRVLYWKCTSLHVKRAITEIGVQC